MGKYAPSTRLTPIAARLQDACLGRRVDVKATRQKQRVVSHDPHGVPLHPGKAHCNVLRPVGHDLEVRVIVHHLIWAQTRPSTKEQYEGGASPSRRLWFTKPPNYYFVVYFSRGAPYVDRPGLSYDSPTKSEPLMPAGSLETNAGAYGTL